MTAKELLALVAKAADTQPSEAPAQAEIKGDELETLRAENARLKALSQFGITQEQYEEQSAYINFGTITPEQYSALYNAPSAEDTGTAQPSNQVDPVSKLATNMPQGTTAATNENSDFDLAIAAALKQL